MPERYQNYLQCNDDFNGSLSVTLEFSDLTSLKIKVILFVYCFTIFQHIPQTNKMNWRKICASSFWAWV
jgi:hypothetical protein